MSLRYKVCRNCGRNAPSCCYVEVMPSVSSPVDPPQPSLQPPTTATTAHSFRTPGCLKAQLVISQSNGEAGYHENQALGWRLDSVVRSDIEHRPACSHFTERHTLCSLTCAPNHMVEKEIKTSFDSLQLLQSWQTLQRDVGKAKS